MTQPRIYGEMHVGSERNDVDPAAKSPHTLM
jgi:hypothetical protein